MYVKMMNKMPRYSDHQIATVESLLLLQFFLLTAFRVAPSSSSASPPAAYPSASGDDTAVVHRVPSLDDDGLIVTTTSSILSPATFLFDAQLFPEFNRTEGFVLLSHPVQLWGNSDDTISSCREASFNTSFSVEHGDATPVSFVVLLDSFPPVASPASTTKNSSTFVGVFNASDSLAFVEVGAVGSYGPESPDVGLNVTVTLNGSSAAKRTVWIQYNTVTHHICVYVSAASGQPRPLSKALVDAHLNLSSRRTTQTAFIGFFTSTVRDVIHGVKNWELSVDRFPGTDDGDAENGSVSTISSRLLILLLVLGSVAAIISVAFVLMCYSLSKRQQEQLKMEHIMKQVCPQHTRSGVGLVGT